MHIKTKDYDIQGQNLPDTFASRPLADLHPAALADLRRSGLSTDTIDRCGLHSVPHADLKMFHFPGVEHALRFPYYNIDGTVSAFERWKLFYRIYRTDRGTRPEYWQPEGRAPQLFLPPIIDWQTIAGNPSQPLLITEGEEQSLHACQFDVPTIGIAGAWQWQRSSLDVFSWNGLRVELVPNSRAWRTKRGRESLAGFYALGMALKGRGAMVRFVRLTSWHEQLGNIGRLYQENFDHCQRYDLDSLHLAGLGVWHPTWPRQREIDKCADWHQAKTQAAKTQGERS